MSARGFVSIARGAVAALLLAGCLPGDTRPPPSTIHFLVEPSAGVTEGVTTADGWHITFDELLIGLGNAGARRSDSNACDRYDNPRYDRLFDLTVPGKQKLADAFALGTCELRFRVGTPGRQALLGKGVDAQDLAFMRLEEQDIVVEHGGKTVHVSGRATREAVTKRFAWSFRLGFELESCESAAGTDLVSTVDLQSGAVLPLTVKVRGEELFREGAKDDGALRFDAFAGADADADGMVTLDELLLVPGPAPAPDADAGVPGDEPLPLFYFVYEQRLLRMVRLGDSKACEFSTSP